MNITKLRTIITAYLELNPTHSKHEVIYIKRLLKDVYEVEKLEELDFRQRADLYEYLVDFVFQARKNMLEN